jgi:predicted nucleic acid-binding Zn ribbon protein
MQPLGNALPGALAELLRSAPLSPGKVTFAWRAAVGVSMQRVTAVCLEGTVLLVDAASAQWAREVTRSAHVILPRLQKLLGNETLKEIRVRPPNSEHAPRRPRGRQQ